MMIGLCTRWMLLANVAAILPCAGQGKRMGSKVSKPYIEIWGRPLVTYTLDAFQAHPHIDEIVMVVRKEDLDYCRKNIVDKYRFTKVKAVVAGGKERQDSIFLGMSLLDEKTEWVVVHDGARPLVTKEILERALKTAWQKGSAVVGVPAKDTIKKVNDDLTVSETPERKTLWQVQTPQIFRKETLLNAYEQSTLNNWQVTDDASLVEKLGEKVYMVKGEYTNIKVTTPEDIFFVKEMIRMKRQ